MNDSERTNYCDILKYDVKADWNKKWNELRPNKKTKKFSWTSLHFGAVYRVTLCCQKDFEITVCNSNYKVTGTILKNTILSVGKTKNFAERMQDHFSKSKTNSNRLLTRLKNISEFERAEGLSWLSEMILDGQIKIEYILIENWWQRDLLESYGKAIHRCLFDLEIEH